MPSTLTFGVEYELKIRLTKAQLQEELDSSTTTKHLEIITNPGPVRLSKVGPQYLRNDYVNFAFNDPQATGVYPERATLVSKTTGQECTFRGYSDEALLIMQKHLQAIPGYESTDIYRGAAKKQCDFSSARLHLTTDASLNGLSRTTKLNQGLCSIEDVDNVDFVGAEIVTAPQKSPLEARDEANNISSALSSNGLSYHIDDECALHVHVGKPDGTPLSVKTLQHLAYLTLVYEQEIARLTVPKKRGADFETMSNRVDFAAECPPTAETHAFLTSAQGQTEEGTIKIIYNYESLPNITKALFDKVDKADNKLQAFKQLMGTTKGRIVNFAYCARDIHNNEPAATVEFRQHQGSLSGDDVLHWTRHCTALVALAEHYAETNTQCAVTAWDQNIDIEHLWREMKLPESTKHFYRQRIQEFEQRWPDVHPMPLFEPPFYFDDDDDFSLYDDEAEASEPNMTEADVPEKC